MAKNHITTLVGRGYPDDIYLTVPKTYLVAS